MKTPYLTIILLVGSLLPAYGQKNLQSRFELIRPIEDAFSKGRQGKLIVTDDIFGQCHSYPHD
ncbi:MAG: hypothetical protein HKP10_05055, partial [Kiritimatiellales bacterium]|nr:hypothetical protein [Kiritimatiellales bacterium]